MKFSAKRVRELKRFAEANGFELVRESRHFIFKRNNITVTVSRTPSCQHAYQNAVADIRRATRKGQG